MPIFKTGDFVRREKDGKIYIVKDELLLSGTSMVECQSVEPDGLKLRILDIHELSPVPKTPI